jgi:hypothetical protein
MLFLMIREEIGVSALSANPATRPTLSHISTFTFILISKNHFEPNNSSGILRKHMWAVLH